MAKSRRGYSRVTIKRRRIKKSKTRRRSRKETGGAIVV